MAEVIDKRIKDITPTADENDFSKNNYIPLDGNAGSKKIPLDLFGKNSDVNYLKKESSPISANDDQIFDSNNCILHNAYVANNKLNSSTAAKTLSFKTNYGSLVTISVPNGYWFRFNIYTCGKHPSIGESVNPAKVVNSGSSNGRDFWTIRIPKDDNTIVIFYYQGIGNDPKTEEEIRSSILVSKGSELKEFSSFVGNGLNFDGFGVDSKIIENEKSIEKTNENLNDIYSAVIKESVGDSLEYEKIDQGKALYADGSLSNNYGYDVITYDIHELNKVALSGRSPGSSSYALACFYDSNEVFISCLEQGKGKYYVDEIFPIVDGAYYIKVMSENSENPSAKKVVLGNNAKTDFLSSYWKGKNIWWCGTSIPAGGYPQIVGENIKANVTNKAVGGSMCRANTRTGDYTGANFDNITSCLSMTKAEIENFISNYDSIKGRLTGNPPSSLSSSYISRMRSASFEDRLLPYLNGTYEMPDLFVIDHGHNDFKYTLDDGSSDICLEPNLSNISNGSLAEDIYMTANNNEKLVSFFGSLSNIKSSDLDSFVASLNRNCYKGAINFICTLILKYNPFARIVFISNYEKDNGDYKNYSPLINAQVDIANSWAFPLFKVYERLGYSDHIIPGTKNLYQGEYSFENDIDVFKIYCPDKVHPHSNSSGKSNDIYAGLLTEFLNSCR